ncbi:hypothetical protein CHARACLAT_014652, partial [Characodon lateralis]|nr:hypothetical protein [Characodon lateralis]
MWGVDSTDSPILAVDLCGSSRVLSILNSCLKSADDSPVDSCGFLFVCRDGGQPHPLHTFYICKE